MYLQTHATIFLAVVHSGQVVRIKQRRATLYGPEVTQQLNL